MTRTVTKSKSENSTGLAKGVVNDNDYNDNGGLVIDITKKNVDLIDLTSDNDDVNLLAADDNDSADNDDDNDLLSAASDDDDNNESKDEGENTSDYELKEDK